MSSAEDREHEQDADERTTVMTTDDQETAVAETSMPPEPASEYLDDAAADDAEVIGDTGLTETVDTPETEMAAAPPPWSRGEVQVDSGHFSAEQFPSGQLAADVLGYDPAQLSRPVEQPDRPLVSGITGGTLPGSGPPVSAPSAGRTAVNIGTDPVASAPVGIGGISRSGTPTALRRPGRGPRRASLQVKRVDPWSVLKLALVLSVAMFFVGLVAVGVLYGVLDGMGVWDKLNGTYNDLVSSSANTGPLISAGRVFGISAIIGAINIVLFTALATIGAFVYNVSADLAGGLEITLAERE